MEEPTKEENRLLKALSKATLAELKERYYSKDKNPKALGNNEARKRAVAGIRRRKVKNEPKYKKLKRDAMNLATVFPTREDLRGFATFS